ncbi:MAG: acyl--CoA ligase [Olsenella sp.]|nr:acyl--CoA ligase [Olsenella sp.]
MPTIENGGDEQLAKLMERLEDGAMLDQPCWSFIKEMNSFSDDRLDSVAIRDGYRSYTYRQMFRYWERYAEAFSGAGITGENRSRVALIGTPTAETIFAFYGLNMTGTSVSLIYPLDLFDEKQIHSMVEREGITDLVVAEVWAFPRLMRRLLRDRDLLGLRNVVVLESPMGGEFGIPALEFIRKMNTALFRELSGGLVMEDLLTEYEGMPIAYGSEKSSDSAVILHTTGTVNGIHKPVPMSDKAINAFIPCALKTKDTYDDFQNLPDHLVSCLTLNMSWVYSMVDMLHMPLGLGMELICLPWGGTNPRYAEAIEYYGFTVMFTSKTILDSWLKTMPDMDLSKLKVVFMGGTYVSPEYKQKFNDYLRSCGSTARIINGYGLSELGGACIISPSDRNDDAIGFPLPGYKVKIYVEDEDRYYDLSDGPHTGILFVSAATISSGKLDDTTFFELDNIDGEDYFNTNDLVRVNEDGSMTCVGRSNQFFINNAGVRFDAGLVQTAITSQPGIVACGLAPEFHKLLHDNVPVLYVETDKHGIGDLTVVHQALVQVFINDGALADTNMPSQCVLVESIPLNTGGKVDSKKLASGLVKGKRFSVQPVKIDDKLVDVLLVPAKEGEIATMGAGVPEELENDPYNILTEVFAILPDVSRGDYSKIFRIPGFRELVIKLTGFDIQNVSKSMMNMMPKMLEMTVRKYVWPFVKGERKMSSTTNAPTGFPPMFAGMMPPTPPMPPHVPHAGCVPLELGRQPGDCRGECAGVQVQREVVLGEEHRHAEGFHRCLQGSVHPVLQPHDRHAGELRRHPPRRAADDSGHARIPRLSQGVHEGDA